MLSTPSAFISIPDVVPFVALVDDHQQRIEEVGRRGGSGIADAVGRLTESSERRGDNDALTYQQTFNFDRFGNMYRKAANNNPTGQANPLPYTAIEDADISKATNRFTADTTYDEAGNVTVDDKFRDLGYSYDANGRMVKATKAATPDASSVYDASGMRVAEKVNDVWRFLIYDIGGKCIAEYGGAASTDEGGVKYPLKDWQGSTRGSISNTGNVQSRQDFTAFGEEIGAGTGLRTSGQGFGASDTLREKYGLTERDDATGLDHTWFRKHENQAGRWTSPDPYNGSMSLGSSQSFNRYSYVESQPTNFVDPSGLNASSGFCVTWVYGTEYKFEDGTIIRIPEGTYTFCFGGGGSGGGGYNSGGGGGGGGGGSMQTRNKGPKAKYDPSKLRDCLKGLLKITVNKIEFDRNTGGEFSGTFHGEVGNMDLSTTTNVLNKDSKSLGVAMNNTLDPSERTNQIQSGLTLGSYPTTNWIASDIASNSAAFTNVGLSALFIHELGNSLAVQLIGKSAFTDYGINGLNNNDKDYGTNLENCVFGGIVGLRSGRVGSNREL